MASIVVGNYLFPHSEVKGNINECSLVKSHSGALLGRRCGLANSTHTHIHTHCSCTGVWATPERNAAVCQSGVRCCNAWQRFPPTTSTFISSNAPLVSEGLAGNHLGKQLLIVSEREGSRLPPGLKRWLWAQPSYPPHPPTPGLSFTTRHSFYQSVSVLSFPAHPFVPRILRLPRCIMGWWYRAFSPTFPKFRFHHCLIYEKGIPDIMFLFQWWPINAGRYWLVVHRLIILFISLFWAAKLHQTAILQLVSEVSLVFAVAFTLTVTSIHKLNRFIWRSFPFMQNYELLRLCSFIRCRASG